MSLSLSELLYRLPSKYGLLSSLSLSNPNKVSSPNDYKGLNTALRYYIGLGLLFFLTTLTLAGVLLYFLYKLPSAFIIV